MNSFETVPKFNVKKFFNQFSEFKLDASLPIKTLKDMNHFTYKGQVKNNLPYGIGRLWSGVAIAEGFFQSKDRQSNLMKGILRSSTRVGFHLYDHFYLPDARVIHNRQEMMILCDEKFSTQRSLAVSKLQTIFDNSLEECNLLKLKSYEPFSFRFYLYSKKLRLDETL